MSVTITLPNELEQFLQNHARRVGVPVETLQSLAPIGGTRLVVLVGEDETDSMAFLRAGADATVRKPADPELLAREVMQPTTTE